ncbi:uncharacterized protein LOC129598533 isoform X2 [Paramacrobiotus metropolitanus]|uniref:uncharacterized protein LOC129598533 isoform X2 n=1 Tax=Paramacrobiotus metropolitanus TaxID=2943436 RepID=UPI0024465665|nr:uncharacterized protein LOC129598533 isoform X2 [Paramacrobiotus metropolitanus]
MGAERHSLTVLGSENRADFTTLELELTSARFSEDNPQEIRRKIEPWCVPISLVAILIILIISLPLATDKKERNAYKYIAEPICNETCRPYLVLQPQEPNLVELIYLANTSTEILVPSLSLLKKWLDLDLTVSADSIIARIMHLVKHAGNSLHSLSINILTNDVPTNVTATDGWTRYETSGQITFASVHHVIRMKSIALPIVTPVWIIDKRHFYLSLSSSGLRGENCPCIGGKLARIFNSFWHATVYGRGTGSEISQSSITFESKCFSGPETGLLSVSPEFLAERVVLPSSLLRLIKVLENASEFLLMIVPGYSPTASKSANDTHRKYWPFVDNAIRSTLHDRRLSIKMLVLSPNPAVDQPYLRSLAALGDLNGQSIRIKINKLEERAKSPQVFPVVITAHAISLGMIHIAGNSYFRSLGISITLSRTRNITLSNERCFGAQHDYLRAMSVHLDNDFIEDVWRTGMDTFLTMWEDASAENVL